MRLAVARACYALLLAVLAALLVAALAAATALSMSSSDADQCSTWSKLADCRVLTRMLSP